MPIKPAKPEHIAPIMNDTATSHELPSSAEPLNDRERQELQNGFWNLDNKGQRTLLTMMKKNQI